MTEFAPDTEIDWFTAVTLIAPPVAVKSRLPKALMLWLLAALSVIRLPRS
jgi:hypothetical protein